MIIPHRSICVNPAPRSHNNFSPPIFLPQRLKETVQTIERSSAGSGGAELSPLQPQNLFEGRFAALSSQAGGGAGMGGGGAPLGGGAEEGGQEACSGAPSTGRGAAAEEASADGAGQVSLWHCHTWPVCYACWAEHGALWKDLSRTEGLLVLVVPACRSTPLATRAAQQQAPWQTSCKAWRRSCALYGATNGSPRLPGSTKCEGIQGITAPLFPLLALCFM